MAISTLALGLGVNAAIFSLTRAVLLRPLPYRDADRLVMVNEASPPRGVMFAPVAPVNYVAWRDRVDAFEVTAWWRRERFNVSTATSAVAVEAFRIAPAFFPLLGVEPAFGRGFGDADAQKGRDDVVLLSNGFWHRQFGGDPSLVGRAIDVDGTPCVVVGVLPPSFKMFHVLNHEVDLYRPFVLDTTDREQSVNLYAKLRRDVTVDAARAQLAAVYASLPIPDHAWTANVSLLSTRFAAQSRATLIVLEWAAAVVLLIACANVANLLLAVAAGRRKELAVRQALGASRWRIARELSGETLLIAGAGTTLGILLAIWIVVLLNAVVSFQDVNRFDPFRVDVWVVAFTTVLALAVTLTFGLLSARRETDADVVDALKDSTHGVTAGVSRRRLRHALIVGELALSIVLLASALTLARSALALHGLARGVDAAGVMTAQISLNDPRYEDRDQLVRTARAITDRLRTAPGVAAAALVNYAPVSMIGTSFPVVVDGVPPPAPGQPWIAHYFIVAPGYFRAVGIPVLTGRDFTTAGDDGSHGGVAIVSERFAQRFWKTTDVVGRQVRTGIPSSRAFWIPRADNRFVTIVGVVRDVREDGTLGAGQPQLYLPYAQAPTVQLTVIARTAGAPAATAAAAIRDAVRRADPETPVSDEKTLDEVMAEPFVRPHEVAWLIGAFAVLALVLSAVGVYGMMAYLATARVHEIRIRIALGAVRTDVMRLIVGHALRLAAIGVAIGVVCAPLALRLAGGLLFGVSAFDPLTLAAVAVILTLVSVGAAAIPANRAARDATGGRGQM
ncbi:MAG: ABC transporter permease [Acidobacteria bacterium]|nr:ABC transporter permease [Acidobacteriota bacterium]